MYLLFYMFVVLGILFYIYLIPAHILNKKRDRLIDEMEKSYTKQKFKKCPHCSVLNPLDAVICEFCKKELPAAPQPLHTQAPETETSSHEKPGDKTPQSAHAPAPLPQNRPASSQLEKFPYNRVWPLPNATALISITAIYLLVVFVYGFVAGIYSLGKQGVQQLEEVTREAAKRQAEREASYAPSPPPEETGTQPAQKPMQIASHSTPTPVPSITPLSVSGTDEEQINQLMLYLESADWNVSSQAKKLLVAKGEQAVPSLSGEIDHPDVMVRTHAITALGEIASVRAIPALTGALSHSDPVTVIQAATALGGIHGEGVVEALSHSLKHSDWRVRQAAVLSLANLGDIQALSALFAIQNDPNEAVRNAVKKAVSDLQQPTKKE
ncbi:HEAT repeat domain-containing protein [Candidatus Sumerlaeota bacterium]|nr:HEAT repeat domain-containing protein [Candidatus Sumerlaeota bacterium]